MRFLLKSSANTVETLVCETVSAALGVHLQRQTSVNSLSLVVRDENGCELRDLGAMCRAMLAASPSDPSRSSFCVVNTSMNDQVVDFALDYVVWAVKRVVDHQRAPSDTLFAVLRSLENQVSVAERFHISVFCEAVVRGVLSGLYLPSRTRSLVRCYPALMRVMGKEAVLVVRPPSLPRPVSGQRNILVTSALPYVNNVPHLGNIIGCVLSADVFARFARLRGYNTLYVCGTDEYGTATETKALQEGLTPQQLCDQYHAMHKEIYEWFDIEFDCFGRTTTDQQTEVAHDIFLRLRQHGHIHSADVQQLKCGQCQRFLADRFVQGACPFCGADGARGDQCDACQKIFRAVELLEPRCSLCGAVPQVVTSDHLFLDLPGLEPRLEAWINQSCVKGAWSSNSVAVTRAWLKDGLRSRCITRDLEWGTPVPAEGYRNKVFYVWFDAPLGYISITKRCLPDHWQEWWQNPDHVQLFQFMGKDNIPFHSILFPSSLLGTGTRWTMPHHLATTEYLNYERKKFSKSRGVGVFGHQVQTTGVPCDAWRYYLLCNRPEKKDTDFLWHDFRARYEADLVHNVGNFIHRALTLNLKSFDGVVQPTTLTEEHDTRWSVLRRLSEFRDLMQKDLEEYVRSLEKVKIRDAANTCRRMSSRCNLFLQHTQPWVLIKTDRALAGLVVSWALQGVVWLATVLQPFMPGFTRRVCRQLTIDPENLSLVEGRFGAVLPAGHVTRAPSVLFKPLGREFVANMQARFAGNT